MAVAYTEGTTSLTKFREGFGDNNAKESNPDRNKEKLLFKAKYKYSLTSGVKFKPNCRA